MQHYVAAVEEARASVARGLRDLGLEVHETPANFVLIRVPDVTGTIEALKEQRILVRDRSSLVQLEGSIRISVGLQEHMDRFLNAMARIVSRAKEPVLSDR